MNNFYTNEYLFSEIYLKELTDFPEKPEITSTLKTIKEYKEFSDENSLPDWKSSFIQKVFGVLGFSYSSEDDNLIKLFVQGKTDKPISLCFSLLPSEDLDNATIGRHWSEKIIRNLKINNLKWGLLTNGNKWRIYHADEPSPYETYLEIDLEKILDKEDSKNYMIFFEFMKADNFVINDEGKCKFDEFKKESFNKIEYIEEELKRALRQREGENGKGVLNYLCMGYVEYLRSNGKKNFNDETFRKEIYSGAMLYMFRLLFIFYASARNLLTDEEIKEFKDLLSKCVSLFHSQKGTKQSYDLWKELKNLFGIIEDHYNGGLFDPKENKFLEENRVSDYFLSRVIYNMNFYEDENGEEKLISYRDMGVRHLGTLYEGLLEHKLFVAEENTQVKIEKGNVRFIPESESGVIVEGHYIRKGEVYFAGDKFERKSTGSYYTPEYIVDYIVTNTVGEKLKELKDEFIKENSGLLENIKAAVDDAECKTLTEDFRDKLLGFARKKILKLSVLDPAMGSGHFLVNATSQISNFITEFLNDFDIIFEDSSSTTYWRRRSVENCIYGVDINPLAVELAKLTLWILSMAKDAHLSFLNHHLKCGNSLIGARLSDIGIYPGNKKSIKAGQISIWEKDVKFKETVEKVITDYLSIEERETVGRDDIEFKKELLDEINEALRPYKKVCDFHTSIYFENDIDEQEYFSKLKKTESMIAEHNRYFHWELEYPEIFRNNYGFNIIIGNPPYLKERGSKGILEEIKTSPLGKEYYEGKSDLWFYFVHQGINILKLQGIISFITNSYWTTSEGASYLRKRMFSQLQFIQYFDLEDFPVFENVLGKHNIFICKKDFNPNGSLKHLSLDITDEYNFFNRKITEYNQTTVTKSGKLAFPAANISITNMFQQLGDYFNVNQGVVENPATVNKNNVGLIHNNSLIGKGVFSITQEEFENLKPRLTSFEIQLVKKYLIASSVKRYFIEDSNHRFLLYLSKETVNDIKQIPNLISYLSDFRQIMEQRRETVQNKIPWYYLHWPRKSVIFENDKIVYPQMCNVPSFALCEKKYFYNMSASVISSKTKNKKQLLILLGILNSEYLKYYLNVYGKKRGVNLDLTISFLKEVPIPDISTELDNNSNSRDYYNLIANLPYYCIYLTIKVLKMKEQYL